MGTVVVGQVGEQTDRTDRQDETAGGTDRAGRHETDRTVEAMLLWQTGREWMGQDDRWNRHVL